VDDGSTDCSPHILARAAEADDRIRLVLRDDNRGMATTTREGIALASGDLIHRAESDDACEPSFLDRMVAAFDANPAVVLASTATRRMDALGAVSGGLRQSRRDTVFPRFVAFERLLRRNHIAGPATVFSLEAHDRVGGFGIPPYEVACDYHLHLRLAVTGDIAYVADRLYLARSHSGNLSGRLGREPDLQEFERESYTLVRDAVAFASARWPEMPPLEDRAVRQISLTVGAALVNQVTNARGRVPTAEAVRVIEKNDPGVTASLPWRAALVQHAALSRISALRAGIASVMPRPGATVDV
jgi:hypothetical protein